MSPECVDVLILSGGLGTRLRSVIADRPKVLAPVAGEPFLTHLLRYLSNHGFQRIILLLGYLADQIQSTYGDSFRSLKIEYSCEHLPLGTGGAIRHALPLIQSDHVLVLNGDSFTEFDGRSLLHSNRCQMLVAFVRSAGRYGFVEIGLNNQVVAFSEKGNSDLPGFINAGVYSLPTKIISLLPEVVPCSLEHGLIPYLVSQGMLFATFGGRFIDIGTPESYQASHSFFTEINRVISV